MSGHVPFRFEDHGARASISFMSIGPDGYVRAWSRNRWQRMWLWLHGHQFYDGDGRVVVPFSVKTRRL